MRTAGRLLVLVMIALAVAACGGPPEGASAGGGENEEGQGDEGSGATWQAPASGEAREPLAVEAVEVGRASLVADITASGLIRGVREARVVSETQGIIREVNFELGDRVEEGVVLVGLDEEIQRLQMEQAERQYETAQFELRATEQLAERGNASQAQLARVRANAVGAEAAYEQAKKRYEDRRITAPISGRIAGKNSLMTVGNYLTPNREIARIVDLGTLEMEIAVGEREVGYLAAGASATVRIPVCEDQGPQQARVASIAAGSDPATGSFPVVIRWENTCGDKIRAGMTANVTIEPQGTESVLVVPSQAVLTNQEGSFVYVATDDTAQRTPVEIGRRMGSRAEIVSGVSAGEVVIISGTSRLRDGDPVATTVIGTSGEVL